MRFGTLQPTASSRKLTRKAGRLMRVDLGCADEIVKMACQCPNRGRGVQHEIHVSHIDCRTVGTKYGVGDRIAYPTVIEEQPKSRVEIVEQACHVDRKSTRLNSSH